MIDSRISYEDRSSAVLLLLSCETEVVGVSVWDLPARTSQQKILVLVDCWRTVDCLACGAQNANWNCPQNELKEQASKARSCHYCCHHLQPSTVREMVGDLCLLQSTTLWAQIRSKCAHRPVAVDYSSIISAKCKSKSNHDDTHRLHFWRSFLHCYHNLSLPLPTSTPLPPLPPIHGRTRIIAATNYTTEEDDLICWSDGISVVYLLNQTTITTTANYHGDGVNVTSNPFRVSTISHIPTTSGQTFPNPKTSP